LAAGEPSVVLGQVAKSVSRVNQGGRLNQVSKQEAEAAVVTTELAAGKPNPDSPIADALNLVLPARSIKPRDSGLTMVMDQGWPIGFTSDMLDDFGYALDIVKLWDPLLRVPFHQVEKRIQV
jgi:hypothetical protein